MLKTGKSQKTGQVQQLYCKGNKAKTHIIYKIKATCFICTLGVNAATCKIQFFSVLLVQFSDQN